MIALIAAAALANSITAPFGIWGRAEWGATHPNVQVTLENRSDVKAWLIDVACNAYDRNGALVGVATGNLAQLQPHEQAKTWAIGENALGAARFACKVAVSEWRRAVKPGEAKPPAPRPPAAAKPATPKITPPAGIAAPAPALGAREGATQDR